MCVYTQQQRLLQVPLRPILIKDDSVFISLFEINYHKQKRKGKKNRCRNCVQCDVMLQQKRHSKVRWKGFMEIPTLKRLLAMLYAIVIIKTYARNTLKNWTHTWKAISLTSCRNKERFNKKLIWSFEFSLFCLKMLKVFKTYTFYLPYNFCNK